jgi:hypothetical protein
MRNIDRKDAPMKHVNLRLPPYVLEFYQGYSNYTKAMRTVLMDYADRKLEEEKKNENDIR